MVNTDVRKLMLFEFNRALSYISEIIEIERKEKQLTDQENSLLYEVCDWRYEEDITEEERREIIDDMQMKIQDIRTEIKELENCEEPLKKLVTKILEAVMEDQLLLEKDEIRQDMLEEYVYLLCEIEIDGEYIDIGDLFDETADFVIMLVEMYGEDIKCFINDILNNEIEYFKDYFD